MNREDARYTISEIRNMDYYSRKADYYKKKIDLIQLQINTATDPKSPQGHEYIGEGKTLTFAGKDSYMLKKITERDELIPEYNKWKTRYTDAYVSLRMIIDQTDEKDFAEDYFSQNYSAQQLEEKYNITKAHRKMIQIVMSAI